jgi:hypothetical protein
MGIVFDIDWPILRKISQEHMMKKLIAIASMAVMTFAFAAPPVTAQTLTGSRTIIMADHSVRVSKLIGLAVTNDQGQKIGTVVDVLVKGEAAEPTVILSVGGYTGEGTKMVAAPLSHIKLEGMKAMMPGATRQMVASMPAYTFQGLAGGGG